MKKRKWILVVTLFFHVCFFSYAQNYPGFNTGNFAGALSADVNPAMLADNLYKFDLTIVGVSAFFDNNYQTITYDNIFDFSTYEGIIPRSTETRYAYAVQEVRGPSFLISLSPLDAFAFSMRLRSMGNVDNLTPELANAIADEFSNPDSFNDAFFNQSMFADVMSWQEYSLSYAKVVQYQDEHFWKVGATIKVLSGMGSSFLNFKTFDYAVDSAQIITIDDINFEFGHSDNFNDVANNDFSFKPSGGLSFGLDLGLIYERRPQQKIIPTFGKPISKPKRNDRPYSYRIGFSLIDIGRIKYTYGNTSARADEVTIDESIDLGNKFDGISNGQEFLDSLATFTNIEPLSGNYTVGLPTTFQVNFDYNLHNGFYINANAVANLKPIKFSDQTVHVISNLTITPRYENDIFGAYMPIYVNAEGHANLGMALRIGPLVFGLNDILPILGRDPFESAGAYVVLKTFTIRKNRNKNELQCKDLYNGWNSKKRNPGRERKNYGDSPELDK